MLFTYARRGPPPLSGMIITPIHIQVQGSAVSLCNGLVSYVMFVCPPLLNILFGVRFTVVSVGFCACRQRSARAVPFFSLRMQGPPLAGDSYSRVVLANVSFVSLLAS